MQILRYFVLVFILMLTIKVIAQGSDTVVSSKNLSGIKLRNIGPAFM